jgi:hypothetical protein
MAETVFRVPWPDRTISDGLTGATRSTARRSVPAVSKHLRVLRETELVKVRADGPRRLRRVRPEPLRDVAEWLEEM